MIVAKILQMTNNKKKDYIKEFKDLDTFNNFKESRFNNGVTYLKYQLRKDGEQFYSSAKTEYANRNKKTKERGQTQTTNLENKIQRDSRNNQLALDGNDLINLNMTPAKQRSLVKFMETKPVTNSEKKLIKSCFAFDKISVTQYKIIEDIKAKANRRIKL